MANHRRPPDLRSRRALVIGLDGVRYDKLREAACPHLRALAAGGMLAPTWLYAPPMCPTLSAPGWATIATGVWPDKHRVTANTFPDNALATYPDFLTRLKAIDPRASTLAVLDWLVLGTSSSGGPLFGDAIDAKVNIDGDTLGYEEADRQSAEQAAAWLRNRDPDAAFVYFGFPDVVGHTRGVGPEYLRSIETADRYVGLLVSAVRSRPGYGGEDWLTIVVSDHGHTDAGGHGGSSPAERQAFIAAAADDLPARSAAVTPRLVDIAPTVLAHLQVELDPAWNLDGQPLGRPAADPFDALIGRLRPALGDARLPAALAGWSHEAPDGWRIDNSRMASGGIAEWRGWTFTTGEFWTAAGPGEGRENFVRSRGVIAVADPSAWAAAGSRAAGVPFDSVLVSPPHPVAGASTVSIRFCSHYRQRGAQKAEVLLSFDDGSPRRVLRYSAAAADANAGGDIVSRIESMTHPVPPGARSVVVRWRLYDARRDGYWAIDDPRIGAGI